MIDETILLNNLTRICVGDMLNEATMMFCKVLECPYQWCNHGEGGARWRTQPIMWPWRMEMMDT